MREFKIVKLTGFFQKYCCNLQRTIKDKKWDSSGVSFHAKTCKVGFDWEDISTLKIEDRRFDRKVREALEIQFRETSPHNEHGLNQDDGQFVTTTF